MDPPSGIFGMFEGARPFPLKIFDTKISVNSTSGECIIYRQWYDFEILRITVRPNDNIYGRGSEEGFSPQSVWLDMTWVNFG